MNYLKNILLISGILLFPFTGAKGQFDAHINQYWSIYSYYNPANAGQDNRLNIATAYNIHSMKMNKAPRTGILTADMPVTFWGLDHGVGAGVFTEGTGLYRNRRVWGQYSIKIKAGKGVWGFGIQGGTLRMSIDPTNKNLAKDAAVDSLLPSTAHKSRKFDVAAGIIYTRREYFLGISGHYLTSPKIRLGDTDSIHLKPRVYFTGGYNIQTRNPLFSIQPSFHLQTDFSSVRLNLTGRFSYTRNEKSISGGVIWSPDTSVALSIGVGFRGITAGYAYELFTPQIDSVKGRHELMIRYSTVINRQRKNKYKHQSIRIL